MANVKDFCAKGDSLSDDTDAIQAAVDSVAAYGGEVYFPPGAYMISAPINSHGVASTFTADNRFCSQLIQNNPSADILNVTGNYFGLRSLGLGYASTPQGGAAIHLNGSIIGNMTDFVIRGCWDGIVLNNGAATAKMTNFEVYDYENTGLWVQGGALDTFVHGFTMNAGNVTRGRLGGIRLQDFCEAVVIECGDVLLGQYSLTTDATQYTRGQRPAYNRFTNVFFDSAANGSIINNSVLTKFNGCWFSGGRETNSPGLRMFSTEDISFASTDFFNCGSHGCLVTEGSKKTRFLPGCSFNSNSATSGPGVSHGLAFAPNVSSFTVHGVNASNGLYTGQQGYGVFISPGNSSNFTVTDNDFSGNLSGGLMDASTGMGKIINSNQI